jgi:hypothetical protein
MSSRGTRDLVHKSKVDDERQCNHPLATERGGGSICLQEVGAHCFCATPLFSVFQPIPPIIVAVSIRHEDRPWTDDGRGATQTIPGIHFQKATRSFYLFDSQVCWGAAENEFQMLMDGFQLEILKTEKEQGIIITGVSRIDTRIETMRPCSFQAMRTITSQTSTASQVGLPSSFLFSFELCFQNCELQNSTYVQRNNSFLQINIIISVAADCSFLFPPPTSSVAS